MMGRDEPIALVLLRPHPAPNPELAAFSAVAGDQHVAELLTVGRSGALRVAVDTSQAPVAAPAGLVGLIDAIIALARAQSAPLIVLGTGSHIRLRYYARGAGFTGPLRGELLLDLRAPDPPLPPTVAPSPPRPQADRLVTDLQTLLPGVGIGTAARAGAVRSFFRGAASGVEGTIHLAAQGPSDPRSLTVAVPLVDDVMAEGVALTIDTALSVRRRFRPLVDGVRVFFDQSEHGLRSGTVAGVAAPGVRDVHLNSAYARASEMEVLERQAEERSRLASAGQSRRPPPLVLPPFTRIDSVVAHEYWHQIEFGLEASRYRDSVAFRRAVGAYFGVETLEHAIKGNRPTAPPAWQQAWTMLGEEVSAYATTAPKEATAELFTQWWCAAADPPRSAQHFGAVLQQFFPTADLAR